MPNSLNYALVTPARNEAEFLEQTILSVVSQTVKPVRWVIVSDGSTDGTDDIVRKYAALHPWIELVRTPERKERHFAGKVHAFNTGYARLSNLQYDVVGNLDADLTFGPDYFEFLLQRFAEDAKLGVAGTPFREGSFQYDYRFASTDHVSGACQLFRRECFESIGGYIPLKAGGIDLVAVTTARMHGWKTRCFVERISDHHRKTQGVSHSRVRAIFKSGYHDYLMGSHPLWQMARSVFQMTKHPLVVGGGSLLLGYLWAVISRAQRSVSPDFVRFRQAEQMSRLWKIAIPKSRAPKAATGGSVG